MEASNAREAIDIFKSGRRFECLFTDVDTPGDANGLELANLVKQSWPPIEVIVTSGHRDVKTATCRGRLFVGKPYNTETIVELIRKLTEEVPT